jgi:hypothetical protein
MKILLLLSISWMMLLSNNNYQEISSIDLSVLVGHWRIDMSPQDSTDDNFAMMKITKIVDHSFEGEFYREGVKARKVQTNTQRGIIYSSFISGDNSGTYNTTFYYQDGMLYGATHAVDRDFLAVWTASKIK